MAQVLLFMRIYKQGKWAGSKYDQGGLLRINNCKVQQEQQVNSLPRIKVSEVFSHNIMPASLLDFRDQEMGQAFLSTCHTVDTCSRVIIHTLGLLFFKSDWAAHFTNRVMHLEWRTGRWLYKDWHTCEKTFEELFCLKTVHLTHCIDQAQRY